MVGMKDELLSFRLVKNVFFSSEGNNCIFFPVHRLLKEKPSEISNCDQHKYFAVLSFVVVENNLK